MDYTKLVICEKCRGTGHVNGGNENSTWSKTCDDCRGIGFFRVPITNADHIRAMSDEELAEFIQNMVDGSNSHNVACYGCINYGTHHSDPANKGTCLYECDGCENEGIGLDVLKWLQQPAEGE